MKRYQDTHSHPHVSWVEIMGRGTVCGECWYPTDLVQRSEPGKPEEKKESTFESWIFRFLPRFESPPSLWLWLCIVLVIKVDIDAKIENEELQMLPLASWTCAAQGHSHLWLMIHGAQKLEKWRKHHRASHAKGGSKDGEKDWKPSYVASCTNVTVGPVKAGKGLFWCATLKLRQLERCGAESTAQPANWALTVSIGIKVDLSESVTPFWQLKSLQKTCTD